MSTARLDIATANDRGAQQATWRLPLCQHATRLYTPLLASHCPSRCPTRLFTSSEKRVRGRVRAGECEAVRLCG